MQLSDFDYQLPSALIAQTPLAERTNSRLLVVNRQKKKLQDDYFYNFDCYLQAGDLLVLNDTRVIPARLFGKIFGVSGKVEIFLLKIAETTETGVVYECLVKPGRKLKTGVKVVFAPVFWGEIKAEFSDGRRLIQFSQKEIGKFLDQYGEMPLPPYIKTKLQERERYQTVFSQKPGSVAAPTAGLHFTKNYFKKLEAQGIQIAFVTLEVGFGTFSPVRAENLSEHQMHSETYTLTQKVVDQIKQTKQKGKKVVAVGTTTVRVLESSLNANGELMAQTGETDIFIYPPYQFKIVDALLTNFHLPKSTLLMLVSAFAEREFILQAYAHAIAARYRFFSFGDAMLIV